ncbi:CD4-1 molecule [Chaetodon trifascialis]|uniref:CD4-1 molecule n=1 Tax=Chaetodon trifascialis TaxID=109706 RepID=UPI003994B1A8
MKSLIQSVLILIPVLLLTKGAEVIEVIYAQLGETVSLKAPEVTHSHDYYLFWHFNGSEIAWRNTFGRSGFNKDKWNFTISVSGNSLTIPDIKYFGTFVGKLRNHDTGVTYKVVKLNVNVNPPSPVLLGEWMFLTCNPETLEKDKKPEIHWLNPQGEKMPTIQGRLTLRATDQHNGQWTCVVTNNNRESKSKISVKVLYLLPPASSTLYTSKSRPLTIPCSIPSQISWEQIKSKGIQHVQWDFFPSPGSILNSSVRQRLFYLSLEEPLNWKPDQHRGLTPVSTLKNGNLSLISNRVKEDDSGDYECTLKFKNGETLSRTVHVNVLQITSSPETDLISGQQVNLSCSVGRPLPSDLRVKWFPPEQSSLPLPSDHHPAHLSIPAVGTGDSGKWKCELWQNDKRLAAAVIVLKIEPERSAWMLVIICSVTAIVVLLLILVLVLYRRRQRKMRHLRHRLCQCKNPKPKGFYRT